MDDANGGEVSEVNLFNYQQRLFERICSIDTLRSGFRTVRRNKGSHGVDGVTVKEYEQRLEEELRQLQDEVINWTYKPSPVRRVEISKSGKGKEVRKLGIPTIRDRVLQTAIKEVLEPIFDPTFSGSSYGFRPGRNQQQAVKEARKIVQEGKEYVVDIDLEKFFDRIHHDRLIHQLGQRIEDKRVLRLIGMTLRSGVMAGGTVSATTEGSVQGSPLSPLLSNVVLDELDKELERRGLSFCRYADDCNIFVASQKAAERVIVTVTKYIEKRLKLRVNREKSRVALSKYVRYLGMTIIAGTIAISAISMNRAMEKVKVMTPRGTNQRLEVAIKEVNSWYRGWSSYYKMTQYPSQLVKIEAHIRRRLRARLVAQQKSRRNLMNKLVKRGVPKGQAGGTVYTNRKRWALSHTRAVEKAFPNRWFIRDMGQKIMSDKKLFYWFDVGKWIKLV